MRLVTFVGSGSQRLGALVSGDRQIVDLRAAQGLAAPGHTLAAKKEKAAKQRARSRARKRVRERAQDHAQRGPSPRKKTP